MKNRIIHCLSRILSCILVFVMMCGVLPVSVHAVNTINLLSERTIYLRPDETFVLEFNVDGYTPSYECYDGSFVSDYDGLIRFDGAQASVYPDAYGWQGFDVYMAGSKVGTVDFYVYRDEPESICIAPPGKYLLLADEQTVILPDIMPETARYAPLTFTSSNEDVLVQRYDTPYVFDIVGTGTAVITATASNGKSASFEYEVLDGNYGNGIELKDGIDAYDLKPGDSMESPVIIISSSSSYEDDTIIYYTDNEDVISVDPQTGAVTALSPGDASVYVDMTFGSYFAYTVHVTEDEDQVTLLTDGDIYLNPGDTFELQFEGLNGETPRYELADSTFYTADGGELITFNGTIAEANMTGTGWERFSIYVNDTYVDSVNFYVFRGTPETIHINTSSKYLLLAQRQVIIMPDIEPSDARYAPLTITSTNEEVLRLNGTVPYLFDIVGTGTAEITMASSNGVAATVEFEVLDGNYASGIYLEDDVYEHHMRPGDAMDSPVRITSYTGSYEDDTIIYYTDNEDVISVDRQTGAVTAMQAGSASVFVATMTDIYWAYSVIVEEDPEYIQFNEQSYTKMMGEEGVIHDLMVFEPEGSRYSSYTCTSSEPDVVSITTDGYYRCIQPGEAVITVTYTEDPSITAECTMRVENPNAVKVTLATDRNIYLVPGETFELQFEGLGSQTLNYVFTDSGYYSDNENLITIDGTTAEADLTGYGWQKVEIYADDSYVDSVNFYVYQGEPEEVYFGDSKEYVHVISEQIRIFPYVYPEEARYSPMTITSSNEDVLRQSEESPYYFDIVGAGTAVITFTASNGAAGSIEYEVLDGNYASDVYAKDNMYEYHMRPGETMDSPVIISSYTGSYEDDTINYYTDNEDVISVDSQTGAVTALSAGSASVYVSMRIGTRWAYEVNVFEEPNSIGFSALSYTRRQDTGGNIKDLMVFEPASSETGTYTYTSSDPDVVYIDSEGHFWCNTAGESVITVTYTEDPSITAQCTMIVVDLSEITFTLLNGSPIYLKPGETAEIEYETSVSGVQPEFIPHFVSGAYGKNITIEGNTIITDSSFYGIVNVDVRIADVSAGSFEVHVAAEPTSIGFGMLEDPIKFLKQGTYQPSLSFTPYNSRYSKLIFSSSDNSVIRPVDENSGKFELVSGGKAKIYMETPDGRLRAEMDITILDGDYVENIYIPSELNFIKVGSTITSPIEFLPEGNAFADDHIQIISSDPDILEVDDNGNLIAHKAGRPKLAVYTEAYPDGRTIQPFVYETPTSFSFESDKMVFPLEYRNMQMNMISDVDIDYNLIMFETSDYTIGEVTNMYVWGKKPGTVTIRASLRCDPTIFAEAEITFVEPEEAEEIIVPDVITGYPGYYVSVKPVITPENALQSYSLEIRDNEDGIAEVEYKSILGLKPGTATAVFKSASGNIEATSEIRILEGKPEIDQFMFTVTDENQVVLNDRETNVPTEYTLIRGNTYEFTEKCRYDVPIHCSPKDSYKELVQKLKDAGLFTEGGVINGTGIGYAGGSQTDPNGYTCSSVFTAAETGTAIIELEGGNEITLHVVDPEEFPENMVARIAGVPYTDLQSAVDAVKDGECITIMTDEPLSAEVNKTVTFRTENGKNVTLTEGQDTTMTSYFTKYPRALPVLVSYYTYEKEAVAFVKHEAVEATCEETGSSEYWEDETTGKYYSDEEGLNEIEENSWIIPALGHDYQFSEWIWADDFSAASVKLVCAHNSEHTITVEAEVTVEETQPTAAVSGNREYTAAAEYGDSVYTDTMAEEIPVESPTVLTVTVVTATGSPSVVWQTRQCAVKYQLYRSTEENGSYAKITEITGTSYLDVNTEAGTEYFYKVRCVGTDGKAGEYSEAVSIKAIPSQPTGITTKNNPATGNIKITWDDMEDAYKYQVYRATSSSGTYTRIGTTEANQYIDTTGESGQTYYYKVRSVTENNVYSKYSSKKSVKCSETELTLTAVIDTASGSPVLSWNTAEEIKYYQLYRSESEDGTYTKVTNTTNTSKTDSTAEAGKTYWYKVRVIDTDSKSGSYSEPVSITAIPSQPTGITTKNNPATGNIRISWDEMEDAYKYQVFRATSSSGDYTRIATTENAYYVDTTGTSGKTYYYKVRSVTENSVYSKYSSKKSAKCSETVMTITAKTDTATGKPKLTWNTAEEIRYYQLYRSDSEDGTYTKIGNISTVTKIDTTAETGQTYWYKVRAIDTNSKSGSYSEPVSVLCKPAKVTGLKVSIVSSTGKPKLTWTAVEDATKYQVYYSTSKDGTYKRLKETTSTSYTHTGAEAGTTYYYKVRAVTENGTAGSFSTIVTETAE